MNANAQHHSDSLHRDPDSTIDRALSALRDAQPRSGLENRILTSLEHRTTEPGGLPFHGVKGWGIARGSAREDANRIARLTLWAATSAAILAVTSLIILHRRTPMANEGSASVGRTQNAVILSGAPRAESKDPDVARRATNPKPFSTTNLSQASIEPIHRMAHRVVTTSPAMPVPCAQSGCGIQDDNVALNATATTPTDAQLLADLHAPSHPAPPLPLTPEEKLFLRMLRYGNSTELAELDPMVRAKQDADETTAFKAFFPDPPPLKQPLGDTE